VARTLLRRRDFRLLAGSVGVSALGDWLALTPLSLDVQATTGSGVAVAGLFVAIWSPAVFLAGAAGSLVDRFDARRLLAAVSLAQAAVATALAFTDALGPILVLTALLGIGFAIGQPAEFALVPAVAGREALAEANGYVETARYAGFTLGPLVGGVLAGAGGTRVALLVNAASFVAVAAAATMIRAERAPAPADPGETGEQARGGIAFLFRDRLLGLVIAVAFASLLFMTASVSAEVFFIKDVLHASDAAFGAMLTTWTLGMALGALVLARRFRMALALGALTAVVVQSIGLALPTLWLSIGFGAAAWLVGGLAHGLKNVLIRTLIHERVPEQHHGRAYAGYNALRNGAELVALLCGGALVVALGARTTLFLAGAIPAAAGIVGLTVYWLRMRERDPVSVPATEALTS
jgi:MFS family permease